VLRSQHRELGMIAFKTADVADDTGGTPARREIGVALRTVCIAGGGQPNCSPMIGVAGSARRRERLRCVMDGAVMARETFLIADLFIEKTPRGGVAGGTPLRENGVRGGQASGRVNATVATNAIPGNPEDGEGQRCDRKPQSPAPQRARPLEIVEIDALREFLGCTCSRQEFRSLAALEVGQASACRFFAAMGTKTRQAEACPTQAAECFKTFLRRHFNISAPSRHGSRPAEVTRAKEGCAAAASRAARRAIGSAA
jgi:hypothetical protein